MAFLLCFLISLHLWSIKEPGIQTLTRQLFWDISLPSSRSSSFPDKVTFLASTSRLSLKFIGLSCGKLGKHGLSNNLSKHRCHSHQQLQWPRMVSWWAWGQSGRRGPAIWQLSDGSQSLQWAPRNSECENTEFWPQIAEVHIKGRISVGPHSCIFPNIHKSSLPWVIWFSLIKNHLLMFWLLTLCCKTSI